MVRTKGDELNLTGFPPGTVTEYATLVCLACIFDIFTGQLGLAPRKAYSEVRKYAPTIDELTAPRAARPFFDSDEKNPHCPYCNAAKRWHARLDTIRIESGKAIDSSRRQFIRSLPRKDNQFLVLEIKSDKRKIFFDWLETLVQNLTIDENGWLLEASRAFLQRCEPKTNWEHIFAGVQVVRRSNQLNVGWKQEGSRLFLSPGLYNELLVVHYLVSRSHTHGGRTLAGRLTLRELIGRLRYSGYLAGHGIVGRDQFEILEKVIEKLAGGSGNVKLYYIVDRRDFLAKVKSVYARYSA